MNLEMLGSLLSGIFRIFYDYVLVLWKDVREAHANFSNIDLERDCHGEKDRNITAIYK